MVALDDIGSIYNVSNNDDKIDINDNHNGNDDDNNMNIKKQ